MTPAVAPLLSIVMGLAALAFPQTVGSRTGLAAAGPLGRSELRALFGGVFVGIGVACVLAGAPAAYLVGGAAFLGGAAAKLLSAVVEERVLPAALPGLLIDLAMAGLYFWGARALGAAA